MAQLLGEADGVGEALLGLEAGFARQLGVQLVAEDDQIGPDLGILQNQQGLAGADVVPFADQDFVDDPPSRC